MIGWRKNQRSEIKPSRRNKVDMDPPEELDGLQWGKSGLEMDEERKKQVCDEN